MYRSLAWLFAAAAAFGACKKADAPAPAPSQAECVSYRNKLFSLLPAAEQQQMAGTMDKATPKEIELCQQRMHSDEIACVVKATTLDDALACKPAKDDRPDEVKRTPDECKAYREHMLKLAEVAASPDAFGPPLTAAMAKIAGRECERWLTKKRFDCVMAAQTSSGLLQCPMN